MRITPACAGKRLLILGQQDYQKDHPRMCGEKNGMPVDNVIDLGSPPHVRGKEI